MAFDLLTDRLWVGDVGQGTLEEIDVVAAGGNYSWPHCEGSLPMGCRLTGGTAPAYEYMHAGSASVTRGAFAVGGTLRGDCFFADFVLGEIYHATLDAERDGFAAAPVTVVTGAGGPADLVFGPDGVLHYVAYLDGEVRRLDSSGFGPPPTTTTTTTSTSTTTTTRPPADCDAAATASTRSRPRSPTWATCAGSTRAWPSGARAPGGTWPGPRRGPGRVARAPRARRSGARSAPSRASAACSGRAPRAAASRPSPGARSSTARAP
jgi:hypothetical protein